MSAEVSAGAFDDPRFDPMWDTCGQLGIPVAIHTADPVAFFDPIDRNNERFEELVVQLERAYREPGPHLIEAMLRP